jgi:hypothetical protein
MSHENSVTIEVGGKFYLVKETDWRNDQLKSSELVRRALQGPFPTERRANQVARERSELFLPEPARQTEWGELPYQKGPALGGLAEQLATLKGRASRPPSLSDAALNAVISMSKNFDRNFPRK